MSDEESAFDLAGAELAVVPDISGGRVSSRFYDPDTGEQVLEISLAPDVARDYAFHLTRASIAVEEHNLPTT